MYSDEISTLNNFGTYDFQIIVFGALKFSYISFQDFLKIQRFIEIK